MYLSIYIKHPEYKYAHASASQDFIPTTLSSDRDQGRKRHSLAGGQYGKDSGRDTAARDRPLAEKACADTAPWVR